MYRGGQCPAVDVLWTWYDDDDDDHTEMFELECVLKIKNRKYYYYTNKLCATKLSINEKPVLGTPANNNISDASNKTAV